MDITLVELHVDGFDFSPSSMLGGSSKSDKGGSSSGKSSGSSTSGGGQSDSGGSSRGKMAALGVLVLLALLAYGSKRMMSSDMDELEELDEIPA